MPPTIDVVHFLLIPHRLRFVFEKLSCVVPNIWQRWIFDHAVGDINPETVYSPVQPEAQNAFEVISNLKVSPIEVWLLWREQVQVPLAQLAVGFSDSLPSRTTEESFPVVWRNLAIHAFAVSKQIAIPLFRTRRGFQSSLKPYVLIARVIGYQVDDGSDPRRMGIGEQRVKICKSPVVRIYIAVISNVIAVVNLRRRIKRRQPNRIDAQS
ncbi:hypothetical protein GALL_445190 [mine drainage metagenome]|uniref:Uncharacterized protein n=1 Tax=mine drainage metagenome TaxID=410659 RepID=A0A1J5PRS3_9ZZZZ